MNTLLIALVVAVAAANAALIPAPAAVSGLTLKGPMSRTTLLGSDGSSIDTAVDAGAVSQSVVSPALAPAMIAPTPLLASRAYLGAPGLLNSGLIGAMPAGYIAPSWNTWGRSLMCRRLQFLYKRLGCLAISSIQQTITNMNALLVFVVALSAANAAFIAEPYGLVSPAMDTTLKGPVSSATVVGPDGSSISAAADSGALASSKMMYGGIGASVVAAPEMIASRSFYGASPLGYTAGYPAAYNTRARKKTRVSMYVQGVQQPSTSTNVEEILESDLSDTIKSEDDYEELNNDECNDVSLTIDDSRKLGCLAISNIQETIINMNALLVFVVALSAANAAFIAEPYGLVSPAMDTTLKGPVASATVVGPDGSSISAAADSGALASSKMMYGGIGASVVAAPEMIASKSFYGASPLGYMAGYPAGMMGNMMMAPGMVAANMNPWSRGLWW
ncbi:hypothetical protein RN001_007348 [Aquatica leii]|uniref:Uncharacterized protein n=1 Tax=Aquatica leii TaxID=1421715 RepID=A0AAN7PY17_9COLE|nr:hypothetical protein RN001_007348 [Aquatica leii]